MKSYSHQYYFPSNEIFACGLAANNGLKRVLATKRHNDKVYQLAKEIQAMGITIFSATPKELSELGFMYKSTEEKQFAWFFDTNICHNNEPSLLPYANANFKGNIFYNS